MVNPPSDSILSALRAATGEAHQRLEDAVAVERCLADPARYRHLLEIFLGFYRPLERLLAKADGQPPDPNLSDRRKTPWLEADLLALGLTAPQIDALPDCAELPRADTRASALGCRYVLEGATLGGRHISAMMSKSPVPTEARRFFGGYGERTGERWREFIGTLENNAGGAGNAQREEVVQGAGETFGCLHRWHMRQCPTDEFHG